MRRLLAAVLSAMLLTACDLTPTGTGPLAPSEVVEVADSPTVLSTALPTGSQVADYFSPPKPHPGPVWTRNGRRVDSGELSSSAGHAHCGWQSVVMMYVGWPLGTVSRTSAEVRQFIRDPYGVLGQGFREKLVRQAKLPADAADTGYRTGDVELWLAPSDPDGAYLRVADNVERWPNSPEVFACK